MDGGSAPPAPDYRGAAEETAAGNLANLNAQTAANRPNQYTPWGSSTWTQAPIVDQAGYDQALAAYRATGQGSLGTWVPGTPASYQGGMDGGVMIPATEGHYEGASAPSGKAPSLADYTRQGWTQTLQLSPDQQQALDNQMAIQNRQSQLATTLQGQAADTMAGGFHAPSLEDYMSGVGSVNQSFGGFTPYGVGNTDQRQINAGAFTRGNQAVAQNLRSSANPLDQSLSSSSSVDLNAPQFSDASAQGYAQHAYDASTALLRPQWEQDTKRQDETLRLQGLTPGTEAYNTAAQNLSRSQLAVQSQLADQAVMTGNNMANQNYASSLAGYGAKNAAQGQAYGQDSNTFAANNTARAAQYGIDANSFTTNNAARTQNLNNGLSMYQAGLQGQNAYNAAQNQAYGQSLAGYGANTAAQQASNQSQQQAYTQAQQGYNTAYSSALSNYLQPLNAMQAVLNGQQVNMPSMPSFATAGMTGSADYTGATNAAGQYANGLYNANVASANSTNAAGASAIAGIAAAFI